MNQKKDQKMHVLAVGCHPDDLEIACTGTLAKYIKRGDEVYMCHVANGNRGHKIIMPDELRIMRHNEAEKAAALIGAKKIYDLDIPDLEVNSHDMELKKAMTRIIKETRPDIIITHDPNDYMADHREVSNLVFDCSFGASVDHFVADVPSCPVAPLFYMDTLAGVGFMPEDYVDVTDEIELKIEALDCHQSQIKWMKEHDKIDFLDFVRTCSKYRGLQCDVGYAEAFRKCYDWPRMATKRLLP